MSVCLRLPKAWLPNTVCPSPSPSEVTSLTHLALVRGGFEYSKRLREIVSHSNQDWIDLKCATVLSYCIFADRGRDDVPDEEHRALARLHTTLKDGISFTESTSPYGPSSLPSGSPSVNGENENEHNQSEEILNFRPANQRPNIHHVETSSLISRLSAFLPTLAAANVELASGIPEESRFELDSNSEQVGEHIEMDLGLGVLEQITPSATESAIRESSTISLTNKRKATDNDIGEGRIPMSLKSTEKKDDLAPGTSSPKKIKLTISGSVSTDSNSNSSGSGKKNKHASGKPSKNKKKTKKLSKVLAESSNRSSDSQPPPKPKRTLIFIPSGNKKFTMQIDEKVIGLLTDLSIQKADLGFEPFPKYAEPSQKECDAINEDIKEKVANNELVGFKVSA